MEVIKKKKSSKEWQSYDDLWKSSKQKKTTEKKNSDLFMQTVLCIISFMTAFGCFSHKIWNISWCQSELKTIAAAARENCHLTYLSNIKR